MKSTRSPRKAAAKPSVPRDESNVERLYLELRDRAMRYEFKPGARINEKQLGAQLGVARATLREALNRLVAEGLLELVMNKGFYRKAISVKEVFDLYQVRIALERQAVLLAVQRAPDEEIAAVKAYWVDVMRRSDQLATADLVLADEEFHRRLVALSWAPPADSSAMLGYRLEAGTAPGRVDALTLDLGTHPGQVFGGVPAGRYFVRVRARFAASLSAPSNDVEVAIGASACLVPDTVARVTSGVASGVVTLSWPPAAGALRHRLLIGESAAAPSLALDVAGTALATAAPPGRYVVRVAGVNACGIGRASSPVTVIVP